MYLKQKIGLDIRKSEGNLERVIKIKEEKSTDLDHFGDLNVKHLEEKQEARKVKSDEKLNDTVVNNCCF